MRFWLTVCALFLACPGAAQDLPHTIAEFVETELPASGAPGVAYAVVDDGTVVAEAEGELVADSGRRLTPDTPFILGSISKSFTALAVMQLVEAGEVDLDAPISRYLTGFSDSPGGTITARQLLSHTSGYSTVQGNDAHTDADRETTLSGQVERVAQWTPAYAAGSTWEYSNANYQVLGALIEAVSGESYAEYMESHVLEPLGMEDSFVADGQAHDEIARGHRPWFAGKQALESSETDLVMAPAGGIVASARDVARYIAAMMNGQDDVLSAAGKAALMQPAGDVSPFYGLGWYIDGERELVGHSGSTPGNETLLTLQPASRKGVVVLVNGGSGIGFGETARLRDGITALALGLDYEGEGSRWQQKAVFVSVCALPFLFVACMVWAWTHRKALRAKSGPAGLFSLWFPLLTTAAMAVVLLLVVPPLFGGSMGTLRLFQPDFALAMQAAAVTGVLWAVFRLAVAYSGRKEGRPAAA